MKDIPIRKQIKIQKKQDRNRMVGQTFCTLRKNERRETPWLGGAWFEPGMEEERARFIAEWKAETERMLKADPTLKIVK